MSVHDRCIELAAASIDFELTGAEAAEMSEHLASCGPCRTTAGALMADARALRRLAYGMPRERVRRQVVGAAASGRRRRAGVLTLLAAAIAVILAVAGGVSVGALLRTDRQVALPTTPAWMRLAARDGFPAGDGTSAILGLAPAPGLDDPTLVAVGTGATGGRVWLSSDGRSWSALPDSAAFARGRPEAVASTGTRIVAVGSSIDEQGDPRATVWTSTDGRRWTRSQLAGSTGLLAVAASPARIVVAGSPRSGSGAPIWSSSDGVSWEPTVDATPFTACTVTGLAVGGPGFVAVGYDDRGAAVWTSSDGLGWTRVGDAAALALSRMSAVTATPAGLIAVGFDARGPAVWVSLDGSAWARVPPFGPPGARMTAVAATSLGVVAVGHASDGARAWASTDGLTWRPLTDGPWSGATELSSVVAHGNLVIAGGRADRQAALWIGALSSGPSS